MKLHLMHGRYDHHQDMEERGFDGPVLQNVKSVRVVYQSHVFVEFEDVKSALEAQELTGWKRWDTALLVAETYEDMIVAHDAFYGDWECLS